MADLLALMWVPFLMCLVLTGIHAYLGIHVIAREVVFVDIALAQIAALGVAVALLVGLEPEDPASYWFGLGATLLGAVVLALTRSPIRVAGVLLVFSYLIVPALAGIAFGGPVATRLWVGWGFGTAVSVGGLLASAVLDLPTGAAVACAFGVAILAWSGVTRLLGRSPA